MGEAGEVRRSNSKASTDVARAVTQEPCYYLYSDVLCHHVVGFPGVFSWDTKQLTLTNLRTLSMFSELELVSSK